MSFTESSEPFMNVGRVSIFNAMKIWPSSLDCDVITRLNLRPNQVNNVTNHIILWMGR